MVIGWDPEIQLDQYLQSPMPAQKIPPEFMSVQKVQLHGGNGVTVQAVDQHMPVQHREKRSETSDVRFERLLKQAEEPELKKSKSSFRQRGEPRKLGPRIFMN